jgi:hypothetical protein
LQMAAQALMERFGSARGREGMARAWVGDAYREGSEGASRAEEAGWMGSATKRMADSDKREEQGLDLGDGQVPMGSGVGVKW